MSNNSKRYVVLYQTNSTSPMTLAEAKRRAQILAQSYQNVMIAKIEYVAERQQAPINLVALEGA